MLRIFNEITNYLVIFFMSPVDLYFVINLNSQQIVSNLYIGIIS
jgi:hypothetical protein